MGVVGKEIKLFPALSPIFSAHGSQGQWKLVPEQTLLRRRKSVREYTWRGQPSRALADRYSRGRRVNREHCRLWDDNEVEKKVVCPLPPYPQPFSVRHACSARTQLNLLQLFLIANCGLRAKVMYAGCRCLRAVLFCRSALTRTTKQRRRFWGTKTHPATCFRRRLKLQNTSERDEIQEKVYLGCPIKRFLSAVEELIVALQVCLDRQNSILDLSRWLVTCEARIGEVVFGTNKLRYWGVAVYENNQLPRLCCSLVKNDCLHDGKTEPLPVVW